MAAQTDYPFVGSGELSDAEYAAPSQNSPERPLFVAPGPKPRERADRQCTAVLWPSAKSMVTLTDGEDLMVAKGHRRHPTDIDLALDRCRGLVRMNRGRIAAIDHVIPVQPDIDDVCSAAALNEFIAVVDVDRVMAAADDRVMTVAAEDRVVPGSGDEQVVAMEDLKKIGGAASPLTVSDDRRCHRR